MTTRDLLLFIGFLRSGKMVPAAVHLRDLSAHRSLRIVHETMADQENALYGDPSDTLDIEDIRKRAALTSWDGAEIAVGTRIGEVPDPGVLLALLSDQPLAAAPLPVEVLAQTLRRYAVRNATLKAQFDDHIERAGTYVSPGSLPDERRQRSQDAFDAAMKIAREQGFAVAAPLFEGVRGECYPQAQIAVALYEIREIGDTASALRRLGDVLRVAPANIAARMQRAALLLRDPGRLVEAAADYLAVLRELAHQADRTASRALRDEAIAGLWSLHIQFAEPPLLESALAVARHSPETGFLALSRYVHTHPCAWDAQAHLGTLALAQRRFDVTAKMLGNVRWIFADDPNPHFVYGQALASQGKAREAIAVLDYAASLSPGDPDIRGWLAFAKERASAEPEDVRISKSIHLGRHVARSILVILGTVLEGRIVPAALSLPKLPGDVPLAIILQDIAAHERRLLGDAPPPSGAGAPPVRSVMDRCVLSDYAGAPLRADGISVGEIADPGVVVAVLYPHPPVARDEAGRPLYHPTPAECRAFLFATVDRDRELESRLNHHLTSPDGAIKSRFGS